MNLDNLKKILEKEPGYRLKQVKSAIFRDLINDWKDAKVLPQELRKKLEENCPLRIEAKIFSSAKESVLKAIFILKDGLKIESVLMRHRDNRNTVCVSSQVGCALCCQFCATGQMGFKRNLDYSEIVGQVLFFARLMKRGPTAFHNETRSDRVSSQLGNIVFMGMGEPFLNYDSVFGAIRVLNDKDGFNLGARHFSISTVGIVEGIKKLSQESLQVNLAVSMHAPDDKLREKIMPINKKYPIKEILQAVKHYIKKTKRKVMFEYVMIRGLNDSDECAEKLARLIKDIPLSFVNLISYNPTGIFRPSLPERIRKFKEILERDGISYTQRYRFGKDINAACGQLTGKLQ